MEFALIDDRSIAYRTIGTGPAIILLHGIYGNSKDWLHNKYDEYLSCYKLVLVDLLGHGQSSKPDTVEHYHPNQQADDIKTVIDHLDEEQVMVWGYSYGARIALGFCLQYPDHVTHLIMGGMHPYKVTEVFDSINHRMKIIRKGMDAWVNYLEKRGVNLSDYKTEGLLANDPNALVAMDKSILSWQGFVNLDQIGDYSISITLYLGSLDKSYLPKAKYFASKHDNASLLVLDGHNHFSAFSDANQVCSLLKQHSILERCTDP